MAAKYALLVMLLVFIPMVSSALQGEEIDIELLSLKCGDMCLRKFEGSFTETSALPMYKQCIVDCHDEIAK